MSIVKIIYSNDIDVTRWDECTKKHQAPIYATYMYLNTLAENWAAIVVNNYEVLFPFCYKIKFGIRYLYMPPFVQQLGIIGTTTPAVFNTISSKLFSFVSYGDIMINEYTNTFISKETIAKTNFELLLNKPHETLIQQFHTDFRRLTKRAINNNLQYLKTNDTKEALEIYYKVYGLRFEKTSEKDFIQFKKIADFFLQKNQCFVRKIVSQENELLSISLFLKDDYRMYNLANTTTEKGRKLASNFLLYNNVLQEFENSNLIFDFEGSDLPGVKDFYKMFKPSVINYFHWHVNHLPWFVKMFKK